MSSASQQAAVYPDAGFVYVLTNAAMPGFVKIGLTRKDDISERLRQLYTTGVAVPFECFYSAKVPDCGKLEAVLHRVFRDKRVNPNREFFQADPDLAKLIIDLVKVEDRPVSDEEQGITQAVRADIEAEKARRSPRVRLGELGIEPGAVLHLARDPTVTCTVVSANKVRFDGEELSLSQAALRAMHALGYHWQAISGAEHWTYQGVKLNSLAEQVRAEAADEA